MKKKYLYEQIYSNLKTDILNGDYQAGDQLPTEKELIDAYNVSRLTAKNAIALLVEERLVERIPGKGTFVLDNLPTSVVKKDFTVGVIFSGFSDAFGNQLLKELILQLEQEQFNVLLKFSNESQASETRALEELIAVNVDALIVLPVEAEFHNAMLLKLSLSDLPVILIDRYLQGIELPYIRTDNEAASYQAIKTLLDCGHQKIAVVYNSQIDNSSIQDRLKGIEKAYMEYGLILDRSLWVTAIDSTYDTVITEPVITQDMQRITEHLNEHPEITAFLTLDYLSSELVLLANEQIGKQVGKEYSLIGFDGSLVHSLLPKYSRMIQNEKELARQTKDLLVRKLHHGQTITKLTQSIDAQYIDFGTVLDITKV